MFTENADSELGKEVGEDQAGPKSSKFTMLMLLGGVGLPVVLFLLYFFKPVGNAEIKHQAANKDISQKSATLANGKRMPTEPRGLSAKARPSLAGKRELLMGLAAIGVLAISVLALTTLFAKEKPVTEVKEPVTDINDPVADLKKNESIPVQEPGSVDDPSSHGWWIPVTVVMVFGCFFFAAIAKNKMSLEGLLKKLKYRLNNEEHTIYLPPESTVGDLRRALISKHEIHDCLITYPDYGVMPYYSVLNRNYNEESEFTIQEIKENGAIEVNVEFLEVKVSSSAKNVTLRDYIAGFGLNVAKVIVNGKDYSDMTLKILHLLDGDYPIVLDASGFNPNEYVLFSTNHNGGLYAYKIPSNSPEDATLKSISTDGSGHYDSKFVAFCENIEECRFTIKDSNEPILTTKSLSEYGGKWILMIDTFFEKS